MSAPLSEPRSSPTPETILEMTSTTNGRTSSTAVSRGPLEDTAQQIPLLRKSKEEESTREDLEDRWQENGLLSSAPAVTEDVPTSTTEVRGLLLMALSALAFSTMSLFVKLGATPIQGTPEQPLPSFVMVFARSIFQLLLAMLYLLCLVQRHPLGENRTVWPWLHLRGIAGSLGLAMFYYALTVLPLADATVLFFTGPVFTAVLAYFVLGEPLTRLHMAAFFSCLVGVVLVARPSFLFSPIPTSTPTASTDLGTPVWGILSSLGGAVMSSIAYVSVRKVTSMDPSTHVMVFLVYFALWSTVLSVAGLLWVQQLPWPLSVRQWFLLLVVGCTAFVGQWMLNRGLQLAPAGPGVLMRNLDVVFAFVYGITLLQELPPWTSYVGAFLIVLFTALIGLQKWLAR